MKKLYSFLVIGLLSANLFAQCGPIAMCAQTTTFSGNVRGYFFTSPVNFTICGLFIPTDASTLPQSIEVVRFDSIAPPAYPATTNGFTSLFYTSLDPSATMIPCNIPVMAGDTIGVYGARGNTTVNSYIAAGCSITILGVPTPIYRSGMQFPLWDQQMHDIFSEVSGTPSSTIMYVDPTASVQDIEGGVAQVSVFPNPSTGVFGIGSEIKKGEAHVYNMLGEEVYQSEITNAVSEINLSGKPQGVYFLRISGAEGKTGTAKLVVE